MPSEFSKIEQVFWQAAEIRSPDEREKYLHEACDGNAELQNRVRKLLAVQTLAGPFLEPPSGEDVAVTARFTPTEAPGTRIGPYKLREQIGEGGFGIVYVAEQEQPVARRVALKIIKPGMDTKEVIARFEAERQALALMDHPNIARVLDAGTTGELRNADCEWRIPPTDAACGLADIPKSEIRNPKSGRPYFVMELVRGVSITTFCDERKLSTRDRLRLFVDVCRAVQHAHQKGVIHRDLKPSNVLVTVDGDRPLPKVIDFGVSKALSRKLTDKTVYTAYGQMVGTPLYMSPEQAELSAYDVDTRSDVYSLGVLLYELLTGSTPFDKETLRKSGFDGMRRIIREVDPPRPSIRISTLNAEALSTVSDQRKVDPGKLGRSLRGELDWIVMKALEKDRNRRYESASAFAADVERYLNDEPVQACPPSVGYRFGKFVRRNRAAMTTAVLVGVSLAVGVVASLVQAERAHRAESLALERLEAEQAQRRLARRAVDEMYTQFAEKVLAYSPRLEKVHREFLLKALSFYEKLARESGDDPEIRGRAALAFLHVGEIQFKLGSYEEAASACRQSIARVEAASERSHQETLAKALNQLAAVLHAIGHDDEAESTWNRADSVATRLATGFPEEPKYAWWRARYQHNLGVLHADKKDYREALKLSRRASESLAALVRTYPKAAEYVRDLASNDSTLALCLEQTGNPTEAKAVHLRALGMYQKLQTGEFTAIYDAHAIAGIRINLGIFYARSDEVGKAEKEFRAAVKLEERVVANFPRAVEYLRVLAKAHTNLSLLLERTQRVEAALPSYQATLRIWKELSEIATTGDEYARRAVELSDRLGQMLMRFNRTSEGMKVLEEGLRTQEEVVRQHATQPKYRQLLARRWFNQASRFSKRNQFQKSEQAYLRALEILSTLVMAPDADPEFRRDMARCHNNLAILLATHNQPESALSHWRDALRLDPKHPSAGRNLKRLLTKHPELQTPGNTPSKQHEQ